MRLYACGGTGAARDNETLPRAPDRAAPRTLDRTTDAPSEHARRIHSEQWYPLYLQAGHATRTETFRRFLASLNMDTDGLAERISTEYAALREQMLHLHEETLEVLHALRTLPVVRDYQRSALEQRRELQVLGLEGLFDLVAIEGEVGVGKPHKPISSGCSASSRSHQSRLCSWATRGRTMSARAAQAGMRRG